MLNPETSWMVGIDFANYFPSLPLDEEFSAQYGWISDPRYESHSRTRRSGRRHRMGRYRRYRGVFFGLRTASAWASVVSGELVRILNALTPNARFTVYVDDILIVAESQAAANDAARFALDLIKRLGLRSSDEKFQPATRCIEYLGVVFDLTARPPVVRCKPEKLQEVQATLRHALRAGSIERAEAKTLVGKLLWLSGVVCGGRTYLQRIIPFSYARSRVVKINVGFRQDARWWLARMSDDRHASRIIPAKHSRPVRSFKSDASGFGGYGYVYHRYLHYGRFLPEHRSHNNMLVKEMIGLISFIDNYGPQLTNSIVKFGVDNTGTCYAVNSGRTRDPDGMTLLRHLADACARWQITVVAYHVIRSHNTLADCLTRFTTLPELQRELHLHGLQLAAPLRRSWSFWRNPLNWTGPERRLCVRWRSPTASLLPRDRSISDTSASTGVTASRASYPSTIGGPASVTLPQHTAGASSGSPSNQAISARSPGTPA
jgi:hypothetical protein